MGFIGAVALVGGLLELVPIRYLPWLLLPVFAGIVVSAFLVPSERGERKESAPKGSLKAIVTHPAVVAFFLMNFLLQVSHGAYYTFFSIHLEQHGYGKLPIGLLWSLGVIAEIGLFPIMHRLSTRFTVRQIVIGSLVLTMIRWGLIAELTGLVPVLIFAQLLHAASYGALHAVSVQYIQGFFGKHHHGQGQALYSGLTFGAGGALGAWMSVSCGWLQHLGRLLGRCRSHGSAIVVTWRGCNPAERGQTGRLLIRVFSILPSCQSLSRARSKVCMPRLADFSMISLMPSISPRRISSLMVGVPSRISWRRCASCPR